MSPERPGEEDDWIERVVRVAKALGMNPIRVRWRLLRWRERWRRGRQRRERHAEHVRYAHKTCHACGHVQDRDARECSRCGARLMGRAWDIPRRLGLALPQSYSATILLAFAILAVYVKQWASGHSPWSMDGLLLWQLGANVSGGEWWRLFTSMFLHVGMWHLAFNLIALGQIGPAVEQTHGSGAMLPLFLATGALANVVSVFTRSVGIAAGASGGLMGLVGVAAGWGHRQGTSMGRDVRNRMLMWGVYTMIFGFFIGADNVAHGAGFACGAAFGYLAPSTGPRRGWTGAARLTLGGVGILATLAIAGAIVALPVQSRQEFLRKTHAELARRFGGMGPRHHWTVMLARSPGAAQRYLAHIRRQRAVCLEARSRRADAGDGAGEPAQVRAACHVYEMQRGRCREARAARSSALSIDRGVLEQVCKGFE